MEYLVVGLLVSIGWHGGKLVYKLVEEIMFTRLHANDTYAVICKKMPAGPRPNMDNGQIRPNQPIGFKIDKGL